MVRRNPATESDRVDRVVMESLKRENNRSDQRSALSKVWKIAAPMVYIAYVLAVGGAAAAYQRSYAATEIDRISEQLGIVTAFKAERISEWFEEAHADASVLQQRTFGGSMARPNDCRTNGLRWPRRPDATWRRT